MINPLYPFASPRPLKGAYLDLPLRTWQKSNKHPLLFSNFVSSLDGRIALWDDAVNDYTIPSSIANARDWRLYQELAAQADVLITSARYYRQWAAKRHQGALPVGNSSEFSDIQAWRVQQAMTAQPDIIIVTRTLTLPLEPLLSLMAAGRSVHVACCAVSPKEAIKTLKGHGIHVSCCGDAAVEGLALRALIRDQNYRVACMLAGAAVHTTLLQAKVLDYMFLTLRHSLVGGNNIQGITQGVWNTSRALQLHHLFHDTVTEQLFACFRVVP
ncbi:MAG: dihydrofolate reductase family protein [Mariprofundaceae bacterium]|nr:dihydrofolate reductase family protein [Mariprofundaceae bacterium]